MRNFDIHWDGDYLGLSAIVKEGTKTALLRDGITWKGSELQHTRPGLVHADSKNDLAALLIGALEDPDRFVAAHVLLTEIFGFRWGVNASKWNGLSVGLLADGRVTISPTQRFDLKRQWEAYLRSPNVDSAVDEKTGLPK